MLFYKIRRERVYILFHMVNNYCGWIYAGYIPCFLLHWHATAKFSNKVKTTSPNVTGYALPLPMDEWEWPTFVSTEWQPIKIFLTYLDLHVSNKDYYAGVALITALGEMKSNVTPLAASVRFTRWQSEKEDLREHWWIYSDFKGKLFKPVLDFRCNMTFEELNGDYSIER